MDVPVNAEVYCADGPCGQSVDIVLNPVTRRVTHLVVRERAFPYVERLVPVTSVLESTPKVIRLRYSADEMARLEPFIEARFVQGEPSLALFPGETYAMLPYAIPEEAEVPEEYETIPLDELTVNRGTPVEATDGRVGQVDEFLVDPKNSRITHLILREGHLWGQKDITIPVSEIDHIDATGVYLKLDRRGVGSLPAIPVKRWWS